MRTWATLALLLWLAPATARAQQHFPSPEDAVKALEAAARSGPEALVAVLGPDGQEIASSGDPVEDAAARKRFVTALGEDKRLEPNTERTLAILHLGHDDWPFPIPLVRDAEGWKFDTAIGKDELLNRRIGRNELSTISSCRAFVDAQHEYARRFGTYAQRLRSTPGARDGLFWEADGKGESPLGPLVAEATAEGYDLGEAREGPIPYHGYYFRVLTAQGSHAPGGARSYLRDGRMTGGFAQVAWPADYGSSGVMTFIVGPQGVVFQKDLGKDTATAAKSMTTYDPDGSWEPTR
jgi:hypothetical protein